VLSAPSSVAVPITAPVTTGAWLTAVTTHEAEADVVAEPSDTP